MSIEHSGAEVRALTPYLAVTDARAALEFYERAFGARRRGEPIRTGGRIGHAELAIGDSVLMLAEESAQAHHLAPVDGHSPAIRIEVSDVDGALRRAAELGARVLRPAADSAHGRSGSLLDPFGHRWLVSQASPAPPVRHGEAGYFTFQVPEAEPARSFYGAVLGWQFSPGRVEGGWAVRGNGLEGGLWAGPGRQVGWKLMYAVDDLAAALDRVRAQEGQAGPVRHESYGAIADCVDNQGIEFWLWQQP